MRLQNLPVSGLSTSVRMPSAPARTVWRCQPSMACCCRRRSMASCCPRRCCPAHQHCPDRRCFLDRPCCRSNHCSRGSPAPVLWQAARSRSVPEQATVPQRLGPWAHPASGHHCCRCCSGSPASSQRSARRSAAFPCRRRRQTLGRGRERLPGRLAPSGGLFGAWPKSVTEHTSGFPPKTLELH